MKRVQRGFTLIELVMVIVILGVLAAVAMPKFVDLKSDAQQAALEATAGSAASASAMNYGGCSLVGNTVTPGKCVKVTTCIDTAGTASAISISQALSGATLPANYSSVFTVTSPVTVAATKNGVAMSCTLKNSEYDGGEAIFEVISAGF